MTLENFLCYRSEGLNEPTIGADFGCCKHFLFMKTKNHKSKLKSKSSLWHLNFRILKNISITSVSKEKWEFECGVAKGQYCSRSDV